MKFKGTYKQKYTLDKEAKELVVEVKLHQRDGRVESGENVYYATATANDKEINHKDLPYCVNAEYMAESIALEILAAWKVRAKKNGNSFRLKRK